MVITRTREILANEGFVPLVQSAKRFTTSRIQDRWLWIKYKREYGAVAPTPDERMWIDPTELKYTIASRYIYDEHREYPRYGILDGSWDQHKNAWKESRVWGGLQQRFEEQKDWEDTTYYRHSMDKLRSGEHVAYLDDRQTVTEFERYLDYLDELYLDIEENGYDPTSIITVDIGRDGEWMVGHGNHRRTIASIIGVESVPVRIKFRHEKWQDRRQRFYDADTVEEIRDADEFLSHPDIPEMTRK